MSHKPEMRVLTQPMLIDVIPEWALSATDESQIAALLKRSFATDFGGRSFFQQRPHMRLTLRRELQIVGHMALMFRAVRLGGKLVDIAGLADVATDPDHRGQGIAQVLLSEAIAQAGHSQAQYLVLFGNANIYSGNGFRKFSNALTYVEMRGARTGEVKTEAAEELMVLPLREIQWPTIAPLDLLGNLF